MLKNPQEAEENCIVWIKTNAGIRNKSIAEAEQLVKIIGAGLAGCEAAWQAANRDVDVVLYDMKPDKNPPRTKVTILRSWCAAIRFVQAA